MDFCHTHVHSQYSLLDGTIRIPDLVKRVKELGMTSCAITDHGNLHGIVDFYKECKKADIHPVLGMEGYCTFDPDGLEKTEMTRDNYHLVILAMNQVGYKNLLWLSSNAYLKNFYYKPRIYWEHLLNRSEGLIITTACLGGILAKQARFLPNGELEVLGGVYSDDRKRFSDPLNVLTTRLLTLKEAFGDRLYIELQDHDTPEQRVYNLWAQRTAWSLEIPLTIATDAHFLRQSDHLLHSLIVAQQMKKTLSEYQQGGEMVYDNKCYIRSPEEMHQVAERMGSPEAATNTVEIASRCNVEIQLGKYESPQFDITKCDDYQEFLHWKDSII